MADYRRRIVAEFTAQNKAKGEMAGFRRDMDSTGQAIKRMAGQAMAVAGISGGIYGLKRGFDYVTKAAMKQEDALFLLEAALKATGDYTYAGMKRYEAFAASIQQATIYGDEEVLSLMQLMKSLGVTSDRLEQATRMAIGLAAATGRDVRSMSMYIALAQQGEFTMLRRYIPALRATTDATEQLQIITEFAANGFKIAEARAETASGALEQMKNAAGDVAEAIGDVFLPDIKARAKGAKSWLEKGYIEDRIEALKELGRDIKYIVGLLNYPATLLEKKLLTSPFIPPATARKILGIEQPVPTVPSRPEEYPMPEMTQRILKKGREIIKMRQQQAEQADMMAAHRKRMLESGQGGTLAEMEWRLSVESITRQMEAEDKAREEAAQKEKETLAARADAYRDMYGQMGRMTEGVYKAQSEALKALRKDYREAGVAAETLNRWYEEQAEILQIEYLQAVAGAAGGFRAAGMQIKREVKTWGELAYEFSMTFQESMAVGLERTMRDFKNWKDHLLGLFEEIYWSAVRIAFIQPLSGALAGAMTAGVSALLTGGAGGPGTMEVPVGVRPGGNVAVAQEGGVFTRPTLAMVGEVPEAFVPLSGGRSIPVEMRGRGGAESFDVHIHNEGSEKLEIAQASYVLSDQRILDVTMRAMETSLAYRRSVAQVRV